MTQLMSTVVLALAVVSQQAPATTGTYPDAVSLDMIANYGTVSIEAWDQSAIDVAASHSDQIRVEIKHLRDGTVEIREHRPPRASLERVDYVLRVPVATSIKFWSDSADVTVRGVRGDLELHGQHGAVTVFDGHNVRMNSTTGELALEGADGTVSLDATAGNITARRLGGTVTAESVGGVIALEAITASLVRVTNTGGDIRIAGTPPADGVYDVASQSGHVTLRLPANLAGRVTYGTVRGRVDTDLPEEGATRADDGRVTVPLGSGNSTVDVITFSGNITIRVGR